MKNLLYLIVIHLKKRILAPLTFNVYNVFVVKLRWILRRKLALLIEKVKSICQAKIDGYSFAYDFAVRCATNIQTPTKCS